MRNREFTAPNGEKRDFWFRDGTNDEPTIIACFEEDYYKVLQMGLTAGDVIIDLGAELGEVALLAATIPGVKAIGVEAVKENCEIMRKNIEEQKTDVKVYENAIWPVGNIPLRVAYNDDGTESGRVHNFVGNIVTTDTPLKTAPVTTITLEQILKENNIDRCKFLKLDIEGAEEHLFATMPKEVLDKFEIITGEYHNNSFDHFFPFVDDFDIERKEYGYFLCRRRHAHI